jgi:hypothetical protein
MSSVFYTITAEVDPAAEPDWFDWYTRVHVRDVLAQPGFVRAAIYKADADGRARSKYVVMYEVASREALEAYLGGDDVHRLRADFQSHYGAVTRLSRQILSPVQVVE